MSDQQSPKFHEGYVLLSQLLYSPVFLELSDPQFRSFHSFLQAGDPVTIDKTGDRTLRRELRRCSPRPNQQKPKYVKNFGRLLNGAAAEWTPSDIQANLSGKAHIPYFIQPSFSMRITGPQAFLNRIHTNTSCWLHVFPDGICYFLIGVRWRVPSGLDTSSFIDFLQHLSPTDTNKQIRYLSNQGRIQQYGDATEQAQKLVRELWQELLAEGAYVPDIELAGSGRVVYLYDVQPHLDPDKHGQEMAGIAMLQQHRWHLLNTEAITKEASKDLGYLPGDWNVLGRGQFVLYTPSIKRGESRRPFMWKIAAADNLARSHEFFYTYFADKLAQWRQLIFEAEHNDRDRLRNFFHRDFIENTALIGFLQDLLNFDRGPLPSYQRKVYAKVYDERDLSTKRERLARSLVAFESAAENWEPGFITTARMVQDLLGVANTIVSLGGS